MKDTWLSLSITNKVRVASDDTKFPIGRWQTGRDRIVVSTSRCGRDNPGSNPGHGMPALLPLHNGPSYLFVVVVAQNKAGKADTFHFLKLAHFLDDFFYV